MKAKKTFISLVCASMMGLSANSVSADPGMNNATNISLVKQIKPITYNFDEFFKEKFEWQDTVENLISYTYSRYNHVVKSVKVSYPGITLEDIIKNAGFWDRWRFGWLLFIDYRGNLNRLGYKIENIERDVDIKGDNLRLFVIDEKKLKIGNKLPYLKMDIDVSSLPDYMDVNEIKTFLEGDNNYMLKTENGKFFYSLTRLAKK